MVGSIFRGRRASMAVVVAAAALLGFSAAPADAAPRDAVVHRVAVVAKAPVLAASWAPGQQGFGTVRPKTVFNGGDPTGLVRRITWTHWGSSTATGRGEACYLAPGQPTYRCTMTRATVVATNLGTCAGRRAYEDVGWYFPTKKETRPGWDVRGCTYGAASSKPVMGGPKYLYDTSIRLVGPGSVRPSRIQLNPETSGYTHLKWASWGGSVAVAHGRSCGEGYGGCASVTVRLSALGSCGGVRAYRNAAATESGRTYSVIRACKLV